MRSAVLAVLGAGVPLVAGLRPRFLDECSVEGVLEYFTCRKHLAEACVAELEEQAKDFCSGYLSVEPVTVVASTEYPSVTVTSVVLATTATTTTELTTTTEAVLSLTTHTAQVDVTETSTIFTTSTRLFSVVPDIQKRHTACPSLVSKNLVHHPASRLSRACSCLGVEPTTSTVTLGPSTAPATTVTLTETSIVTEVVSETNILTATSVSVSVVDTTVTSTTTALATAVATVYPNCDPAHWSSVLRYPRDTVNVANPAGDLASCCRACQETLNCLAGVFVGTGSGCVLTIKTGTSGPRNDMCPLSVEPGVNVSGPPPDIEEIGIFKGPCHQ